MKFSSSAVILASLMLALAMSNTVAAAPPKASGSGSEPGPTGTAGEKPKPSATGTGGTGVAPTAPVVPPSHSSVGVIAPSSPVGATPSPSMKPAGSSANGKIGSSFLVTIAGVGAAMAVGL
ncbi:unnamed protein product [Mortierella alpina]